MGHTERERVEKRTYRNFLSGRRQLVKSSVRASRAFPMPSLLPLFLTTHCTSVANGTPQRERERERERKSVS